MDTIESKDQEKADNEEYSKNFARIPNMLFSSFKHLSKEEKFLYCTLKSIYWDAKPRFVSLRDLGEMTGYSRGALGNMLPRLHTVGLIHAEIRREKNSMGIEIGNPKYNLTILDIWELNRAFYACPANGRDALDPSLKLVHETSQACPANGQTRPPNEPKVSTKTARTVHQMDKNTSVNKPVEASNTPPKERRKTSLKTSLKKGKERSPIPSFDFTPEEKQLLDWIAEEQYDHPVNESTYPKIKEQLMALTPSVKTKEDVKDLCAFIQPKIHGDDKTVYLGNMVTWVKRWAKSRQGDAPVPQKGMTREEFDEVVRDMRRCDLWLLCAQSEETELYFIGIADSDTTQIDINCPNDWYHLPMEQLTRALVYAQQQKTA